MQTPPIRVLLVDDNGDLRRVYARLLDAQDDLTCVGQLGDADDLVNEVNRMLPHVVVLDLTMPGRAPLEALADLTRDHPEVRTIAFSGYDDEDTFDAALAAGAWGLVSKHDEPKAVLAAIRSVMAGDAPPRKRP